MSVIKQSDRPGALQAVVLDWAGTAVDYGCQGPVSVFVEVFKRRGVEVTPAEARAPMGLMKKDHLRAMCAMNSVAERWHEVNGAPPSEDDVEAMYAITEPMMIESIRNHAEPVPGLLEVVRDLREQGLKIGSTTGYTRPMMEVMVPLAREWGYEPDAVICSTDAPAGRPRPWMCYLNAMALDVYPMAVMVKVGDTVADIEEGLNAGMWTVGVTRTSNELGLTEDETNALPGDELQQRLEAIDRKLRQAGAHEVIEGIRDLPAAVAAINQRLENSQKP